jgi:hypothetical protein
MADETTTQPADPAAAPSTPPTPHPAAQPPENAAPTPVSSAERLRAFEDEHIGKDAVRIDGKIERGSGSPFQKLSDELKRQYAALERLIAAEQKVADARAALAAAESEHAVALIDAAPGK